MRFQVKSAGAFVIACTTIAVASCSSSHGPAPEQKKDVILSSPYTYKFLIDANGARTEVHVVPQEVANAAGGGLAGGTPSTQSAAANSLGLHPLVDPGSSGDDGGQSAIITAPPGDLIIAAAAECGMVADPTGRLKDSEDISIQDIVQQEKNKQITPNMHAVLPPWSSGSYFIFSKPPVYCDAILEDEETLVCIADKLSQLADTIAPLEWHAPAFVQPVLDDAGATLPEITSGTGTWIMPPPSEADKFIVRDEAIFVLSEIPTLDSDGWVALADGPVARFTNSSCSALYQEYQNDIDLNQTPDTELQNELFGGTIDANTITYPPNPLNPPALSGRSVAQERFAFEASILRSAGQLLHDLVRESVYSDLAGAAAVGAATGDPRGGQQASAGLSGNQPFNSLAHIARTLYGRWETYQPGDGDPRCMNVAEAQLFPALADNGMRARANDLGATTANESIAETLFEEAGIVLTDGAVVDLASTLVTQLQIVKGDSDAGASGDGGPTSASQVGALAISNLVATLSPSDLARAAQHNRVTFSLLTNAPTSDASKLAAAAATAGLSVASTSAVPSVAGIVIAGGLPQGTIVTDPIARSGPMMAASECAEFPETAGVQEVEYDELFWNAWPPASGAPAETEGLSKIPMTASRQDVFAIGNAIRSRLVKLRERADGSAALTTTSTADQQARAAAVAEVGAWAGSGRLVLTTIYGDQAQETATPPSDLNLHVIGVNPADVAVSNLSDLPSKLVLVYDDPHIAECVAHLAINCPDPTTLQGLIWTGIDLPHLTNSPSAVAMEFGQTGDEEDIDFSLTNAPTTLQTALTNSPGLGAFETMQKPLYVVLLQDPTKPTGIGEVLGVVRLPVHFGVPELRDPDGGVNSAEDGVFWGESAFALSPMRRELAYDAFGLGRWVGAAPPHAGEENSAGSPSYCIENVPRNMFVPLQNDLTDSTDAYENSWNHYLGLAQAAATNADNLGQELVDIGFMQTQTVENAAEQLLSHIGSATDVSSITIDSNGNISAGQTNGALGAVLNQPTLDVVLFGSDPNGPSGTTSASVLSQTIGCPQDGSTPANGVCTRLAASGAVAQFVDPSTAAAWPGATDPNTVYYTALGLAPPPGAPGLQCTSAVTEALKLKGLTQSSTGPSATGNPKFNATAFGNAVRGLAPQQMAAALAQMTMTVDDGPGGSTPGHWSVALNGQPLMDSDSTDPGMWPGCVPNCNYAKNPVLSAFNDLFRKTPNPRTDLLGQNYLNGSQQIDKNAELNELRWRVQGTIWLAAAMSGNIPKGMFKGPVPAVNFPSTSSTLSAPINTIFNVGQFNTNGGTISLVGGANSQETKDLGTGLSTPASSSRYFDWTVGSAQFLPTWLRTLYAPLFLTQTAKFTTGDQPQSAASAPLLVHIQAQNERGQSDYTNLSAFFSRQFDRSIETDHIDATVWPDMVSLFDGQQCTDASHIFTNITANDQLVVGLVAALKTGQATGSDMRKPFYLGDSTTAGEWVTTYQWNDSDNGCQSSTGVISSFGFMNATTDGIQCVDRVFWNDQPPVRWRVPALLGGLLNSASSQDYWQPFSQSNPLNDQANPSKIPPGERIPFAINSGAPIGDCDAAWQMTQAMALSCLVGYDATSFLGVPTSLPDNVTSLSDLAQISAYLDGHVAQAQAFLSKAYVTAIPAAVVANATGAQGTLTSQSGTVGQDVSESAIALLGVYNASISFQGHARAIADDLQAAQAAIAEVNDQADITAVNQHIEELGVEKQIADDTSKIASGIGNIISSIGQGIAASLQPGGQLGGGLIAAGGITSGLSEVADGVGDLALDGDMLNSVKSLAGLQDQATQDAINGAIATLNKEVNADSTSMLNDMVTLRTAIANVSAGAAALSGERSTVAYYAGKATGADVWNCGGINGPPQECVSRVNAVLNRRYDGTQIRYEAALQNAKAMAYIARLAIEQRIGERLNDITVPIGTLQAPSTWADDVCHLTGIDYKRLATQLPDAGSLDQQKLVDQQVASEFADQFIGDYVQELTDFVSFYNTTYPEQDGNDVAVLSLRETLLGGARQCQGPAANLLVDSSRLYLTAQGSANATVSGWAVGPCADANCLNARALAGLAPPTFPGGATWLVDQRVAVQGDGGADGGGDAGVDAAASTVGIPDDVETQQVALSTPGTYVLSWWDQALDSSGNALSASQSSSGGTSPPAYRVGVYDSAWRSLEPYSGSPSVGGWSSRRSISFSLSSADVVHVVVSASVPGGQPGSVAIANMQLEAVSVGSGPTGYQDTDSSGNTTSFDCAVSPADMRGHFTRRCDADGTCHYDLDTPLTINTQTMTSNGVSLADKLAVGNFNFRHVDVAVNVVGTGVIDCSGTASPDCFGSGYLQYTLDDDGSNVGVLGFDKQYRSFDFGTATIDHGKALTAERYLTLPLGSSDQQLIGQVEQTQFRGRPIDGVYRLKIYDTPALHFDQVQDVQIILNYHYWSRVITSKSSN